MTIQTKKIQFTSVSPFDVFSSLDEVSNTHIYKIPVKHRCSRTSHDFIRLKTINNSVSVRSEVHDCIYRCQKHTRRLGTRDRVQRFVISRVCSGVARPANQRRAFPTIKYLGQSRELCVSKQNIFFFYTLEVRFAKVVF